MLPKIEIRTDEIGRGVFLLDGREIPGVVGVEIDVQPGKAFVTCTLTIAGSLEAELFVEKSGLAVAVLSAPVGAGDGE